MYYATHNTDLIFLAMVRHWVANIFLLLLRFSKLNDRPFKMHNCWKRREKKDYVSAQWPEFALQLIVNWLDEILHVPNGSWFLLRHDFRLKAHMFVNDCTSVDGLISSFKWSIKWFKLASFVTKMGVFDWKWTWK